VFVQFCSLLYFPEFGFVWETSKPSIQVIDLSGRIILKWILKKCDGKQWIGFVYLKIRTNGSCCEFGNEIPPFIQCCKFFTSRAAVSFSANVPFRVVSEPHLELLLQMEGINFCRGWNIPKVILSLPVATATRGPDPPNYRGFTITLRHTKLVGLLWTTDQTVSETSTWQHTHSRDGHRYPRRDSNPQSQQASGRRPNLRPPSYWDRLPKPYNRHKLYWNLKQRGSFLVRSKISHSSPQLSDAPKILHRAFTGYGFGHRMYLYVLYPSEHEAWLYS
jgi:hypothetical protein